MYQLDLSSICFSQDKKAEFLQTYWQKKPVVIRNAFAHFQDPISADEIAGFACEEQVQSRLVYKSKVDNSWQAEFGPFQSYQHLGEKNWSLVVQALDNWSEDAAQLIEPFRFIPHWRLDDLMVSFATPGGGVGPHIDLYDVFICQGSGKRNWRVGSREGREGKHREFSAHAALLHVEPFDAIIDVELNPGDILYIPPGFPHEGITLETSLSFSVGFRTNSTVSLFSGFADHLIDNEQATELIEDPSRKITKHSGAIDQVDFHLIKNQLSNVINNDGVFRQFVGCFLTQAKHELDLIPADEPHNHEDIQAALAQADLKRLGGLRAFYFPETLTEGLCYIDGQQVCFPAEIAPVVKLLCDNVMVTKEELSVWQSNKNFITFIESQLNCGYWYFS
jgi:50S ribosomal protein L16 3-hydroxylase